MTNTADQTTVNPDPVVAELARLASLVAQAEIERNADRYERMLVAYGVRVNA